MKTIKRKIIFGVVTILAIMSVTVWQYVNKSRPVFHGTYGWVAVFTPGRFPVRTRAHTEFMVYRDGSARMLFEMDNKTYSGVFTLKYVDVNNAAHYMDRDSSESIFFVMREDDGVTSLIMVRNGRLFKFYH
mgnify:CR=1 FL=1